MACNVGTSLISTKNSIQFAGWLLLPHHFFLQIVWKLENVETIYQSKKLIEYRKKQFLEQSLNSTSSTYMYKSQPQKQKGPHSPTDSTAGQCLRKLERLGLLLCTYTRTRTHTSCSWCELSPAYTTVWSACMAWEARQPLAGTIQKTNTKTCFGDIQWIEFMVANLPGMCRLMCQLIGLGNQSPSSPNHRTKRMHSELPVPHWKRGLLMSSATKYFTLLMHQHFASF